MEKISKVPVIGVNQTSPSSIEIHPFEPFVPNGATHLILGTFPTLKKNWRFETYYPGRSNFFWKMLANIYEVSFKYFTGTKAADERLALCAEKGIALSDTVYSCRRSAQGSSKDSDLIIIEKMNILKMLHNHRALSTVILTGSSGPVSAHKLFYEHLEENRITYQGEASKPPIHGNFQLGERKIMVHTLYSTSGINIGRYDQALKQYEQYLRK